MIRAAMGMLAMFVLATSLGCHHLYDGPPGIGGCADGSCAIRAPRPAPPTLVGTVRRCLGCGAPLATGSVPDGPPGPDVGTVTYPYYTTRGPRDFLTNNPPSIGN